MIVGYYQWKNLYENKTDIYLKASNKISFMNVIIEDMYGVELQKVKVYEQFTSLYGNKPVLALRVDTLDFIPELCLGGFIKDGDSIVLATVKPHCSGCS